MNEIVTKKVQCPHCWEMIEVLLDCSVAQQCYIEDCQVCCKPIEFLVTIDHEGEAFVEVSHED